MTLPERRQRVQRAIEVMTEWVNNVSSTFPASKHMGNLISQANEDGSDGTLLMLGAMISLCGYALTESAVQTGRTESEVLQAIARTIAIAQANEV